MRNALRAALTALAVVAAVPPSSHAGGHGDGWHGGRGRGHGHGYGYGWRGPRVVIGGPFAPGYWWSRPRPWGFYPPFALGYGLGYGAAPYAAAPPVVIQQTPPAAYVQQDAGDEATYWYYCQNPQGYYPYVTRCSSGWMQVVPPEGPPS